MRNLKTRLIFTAAIVAALFLAPKLAMAYCGCEVHTDIGIGTPCMVVNDAAYTFGDSYYPYKSGCKVATILGHINNYDTYCRVSEGSNYSQVVLFQPEVGSSISHISGSTETILDEPVSITFNEGQRIVLSGLVAPWESNTTPFAPNTFEFTSSDMCGYIEPTSGGYEYGYGYSSGCVGYASGATGMLGSFSECDATIETSSRPNYKALITIKDIPEGRAAFEISGPGTLILRDIEIDAKCENDPDDPSDDYKICGSVFKVKDGAKLIIVNSELKVGQRVQSIVEIEGNDSHLIKNQLAFVEDDDDNVSKTKIDTQAVVPFVFETSKVISSEDFDNVKFEHIGVESGSGIYRKNYFWKGVQGLIETSGIGSVKCKLSDSIDSCVISDLHIKFVDTLSDGAYRDYVDVLYVDKQTGKIKDVGELEPAAGSGYSIALPEGFENDKMYLITNLGQHIRIDARSCPDGSDPITDSDGSRTCEAPNAGTVFDSDTWSFTCKDEIATVVGGECVCPEHSRFDAEGMCIPQSGYEWKNGDHDEGVAYQECRGESVPANDSSDRAERCVCPAGELISWSSGGISRCNEIRMPSPVFFIPGVTSSTSTPSDVETEVEVESSTDTDDIVTDDESEISDEEICLESGGEWVSMGLLGWKCYYPETELSSDADIEESSSSCSLLAGAKDASSANWMVFFALPALLFWLRRRDS